MVFRILTEWLQGPCPFTGRPQKACSNVAHDEPREPHSNAHAVVKQAQTKAQARRPEKGPAHGVQSRSHAVLLIHTYHGRTSLPNASS